MMMTRGRPSERARRLKERLLASPFSVDVERARYYTDTWRRMEDSPPCMRAACALEGTLRNMSVSIDDDELLVGVKAAGGFAEPLSIERGTFNETIELMLTVFSGREFATPVGGVSKERMAELGTFTDEDKSELLEDILPYWHGRTMRDFKWEVYDRERLFGKSRAMGPVSLYRIVRGLGGLRKAAGTLSDSMGGSLGLSDLKSLKAASRISGLLRDAAPDQLYLILNMQGHIIPGYRRVLELGFSGIGGWAERELAELGADAPCYSERKDFYESVSVAAKAVSEHSKRYAELAGEMAETAVGERKEELLEIAERCLRVPAERPRSFLEALQSIWMTQVTLVISYGVDNVFTTGRMDQYLYPYYKSDVEAGRISREQALEAIEEFMIKVSRNLIFGPNNITIGGMDTGGDDATNEVSYLFLEALENIRGMGDGLAVRISQKTPRDFFIRACETHRITAGVAFYNDEIVIRDLLEDGYSIEDACDYSIVGCVEPTGTGNDNSYTAGNAIFLVGVLEMALNEGRRLLSGSRRVGARTPRPRDFRTFEDVKRACLRQLRFTVDRLVRAAELKDRVFAEAFPAPLLSSTIEGCLESGYDITRGGARNNNGHVNAQGLATVANSLAAIRWAVFEKQLLTMEELARHLRNNFRGAEELRQELLRKAPKFGNDDPRADELAEWVAEAYCSEVRKHRCWRGGIYRPSMFSSGTQDMEGATCMATPDGRLAGESVSNGISPANATEANGATAVFHSVAAAGSSFFSDGVGLNMNLDPGMLESDENVEKLASLIEAYFVLGGRHVQFNPVDGATLRDAQAHPENYLDLTVKVSGYSARFVDLCRSLQEDIIARHEFSEL